MLAVAKAGGVKRVVRVTGKGEAPWSPFSILINLLGSCAKAWNYEGEQLLRAQDDVDYTIVRPGVMGTPSAPPAGATALALADNGGELAVSPIAHGDVARLCVGALGAPNASRATLTAMTVPVGEGATTRRAGRRCSARSAPTRERSRRTCSRATSSRCASVGSHTAPGSGSSPPRPSRSCARSSPRFRRCFDGEVARVSCGQIVLSNLGSF